MLRRIRGLNAFNHTEEDMGDIKSRVRSDLEDSLLDALVGCHEKGSVYSFREWLRKYEKEFRSYLGNDVVDYALNDADFCWRVIHELTCELRRMAPFYEWSANVLVRLGCKPGQGMGFLNT